MDLVSTYNFNTTEISKNNYKMNNSRFIRVTKLGTYLLTHPAQVPKYIKTSLLQKSPVDLGLPWISYAAIDFLDKWQIDENTEILELGGGGSTIYFGKRNAQITCFESNEDWHKILVEKCKYLNIKNVDIKLFLYDNADKKSFLLSEFYNKIAEKQYDIILVDNYDSSLTQPRVDCFYKAEKSVKPGGIIILDDSWRYDQVRKSNSAKKHIIFQSIGPCRRGLTSTDIYFY
jgi:predicted O-methyltransferase YrrM